jgi:hypothetical protein
MLTLWVVKKEMEIYRWLWKLSGGKCAKMDDNLECGGETRRKGVVPDPSFKVREREPEL